eukprot:1148800-Pelagomonas_calceolata.AAC.3
MSEDSILKPKTSQPLFNEVNYECRGNLLIQPPGLLVTAASEQSARKRLTFFISTVLFYKLRYDALTNGER